MKPYIFLLRKHNHEGKPVIHSSWIGHKRLPKSVIDHTMPLWSLRTALKEHGYTLQRLA